MTKETARAKRAGGGGRGGEGRGWTTPAPSSTAGARTVIKAAQRGGGRIDTIDHSRWVWGARVRPCCVRRSPKRPETVAVDDDDAGDDDGGDCMRCRGAAPIGESTPAARSSFYARLLVTKSIYKIWGKTPVNGKIDLCTVSKEISSHRGISWLHFQATSLRNADCDLSRMQNEAGRRHIWT